MQEKSNQPSLQGLSETASTGHRRELKRCMTTDTVGISDSFESVDNTKKSEPQNRGTPTALSLQITPRRRGRVQREDGFDGNPAVVDIGKDMERVMALMKEETHLKAFSLYQKVLEYVENLEHGEEKERCIRTLEAHQEDISTLKALTRLFEQAKQRLLMDDTWIECHQNNGIKSSYRIEGNKTLSLKIEGDLTDVPLFEQVSVLREVDLYHEWSPCCKKSRKLHDLGRLDTVGWMEISVLGFVRDSIFRCVGCNAIDEEGRIILVANGLDYKNGDKAETLQSDEASIDFLVQDSKSKGIEIPPKPKGFGAGRLKLKKFEGIIDVTSPTSAKVFLVANIDPIVIVSKPIISFIMKHMCGILLSRLQSAALGATNEPLTNPHAQQIRKDPFYMDWLRPKFEKFCEKRDWTLPTVTAFDIDDNSSVISSRSGGSGTNSTVSRAHAFTKEQIDRLRQLEEYKDTLEKKRDRRRVSSMENETFVTRIVTARPRRSSAALLVLMLFLFYGDISSALPWLPANDWFTSGNDNIALFLQIAKAASNLSFYICIHWSVMATLLVSFFERIESATIVQYMPTIKKDFVQRTQNPIFSFSCGMIAVACSKAMCNLILSEVLSHRDQVSFHMAVMDDTKCMMTYSAVFLWLCSMLLSTIFPKQQEGSFKQNGSFSSQGIDGRINSDEYGSIHSGRSNHEAIAYDNVGGFDPDLSSLDDATFDAQLRRKGFRSRFMKRNKL